MEEMQVLRERVNARLAELFENANGARPKLLNDAMWYSVNAGGKRLRPCMLLATSQMLGGEPDQALDFACAVEMIHTYSLIHDDLPGMDNDTMRRGRPTNHVVFSQGQAILAGDGLLNLAFETMLDAALRVPKCAETSLKAISEIARGAGVQGMVAGQCLDLQSERDGTGDFRTLEEIHTGKTACMFLYPMRAAARLCEAAEGDLEAISRFAMAYGLLFQAADDLTDVVGNSQEAGKTLGKDAESGKLTCVSQLGLEGTAQRIRSLNAQAHEALERFGEKANLFRELADKAASVAEIGSR